MSIKNNTTELQALLEEVNNLPEATELSLQEKTVIPTTSTQSVTPDSGYDGLSKVTVNAMPTATQATPSITVSSAGLITASATQPGGYVASGTKSSTKQLTVQAAKTITPSTASQTAVAKDRYTTGAVTVAAVPTQTKSATPTAASQTVTPDSGKFLSQVTVSGDANLKAENIAEGVSIFGVTGTHSGGGGGASVETCTVTITADNSRLLNAIIPIYSNGAFDLALYENPTLPLVVENVVTEANFCLNSSYDWPAFTTTNGSLTIVTAWNSFRWLKITANNGANVAINIYNND